MTIFRTIWQYFPAVLIAIGAFIAAVGGFWQALRQAHFNSELRQKNETIIELQQQNAGAITGGDSFAEMVVQVPDITAVAVVLPMFVHHGKFPLYDVAARVVDLDECRRLAATKNYIVALQGTNVAVGSLTPGFVRGPIAQLQHPSGKDLNYNVFFVARNGSWTQQLRMRWGGNGWSVATRIIGLRARLEFQI